METKSLLSWYFNPKNFAEKGKYVFSPSTVEELKKTGQRIRKIMPEGGIGSINSPELIENAKRKFLLYVNDKSIRLTSKEVRMISYELGSDWNSDLPFYKMNEFKDYQKLLNSMWSDTLIYPIWSFLMRHWFYMSQKPEELRFFVDLIQKSLRYYNGNRKRFLSIKPFADVYFNDGGQDELSTIFLKNGVTLTQAPKHLDIEQPYLMSQFLVSTYIKFIQGLDRDQLSTELLGSILVLSRSLTHKASKLKFLSVLVLEPVYSQALNQVSQICTAEIGDPMMKKALWRSNELTEEDQEYVERARAKLQILINKKFISYFFEKLVRDHRRKKYWVNKAESFTDVYFVGNEYNRRALLSNSEMAGYVSNRYKTITGSTGNCAIIMYTNKHVFVDFSEQGALYIYKLQSFRLNLDRLHYLEELKIWDQHSMAVRGSSGDISVQEEGRVIHVRDTWESRLNVWMRRYFDQ